ncbi:MAG: hypothetical protein COB20_06815 [SAR86 cluster bacterium]|uniref:Copper-binding protein MbnP-like domain-containing protein n=1 Tax=SAR86 cluster bacterium TaxID=2030880 RepID=A0A2A4X8F1_9GAMM|nr:MAG: hypothetical protein COB20_06815 [SAR86 cluster bacterium]
MTFTSRKIYFLMTAITLAAFLLAVSYTLLNTRPMETVSLHFEAVVDDDPLLFDQLLYPNPGGEGDFKIISFLFYLSNIKLVGAAENYVEADSYHLVRFDNRDNSFTIELENVPRQNYETIEFSIGVDATANNSINPIGDLDSNGRMAWSWDVGYKFVLFEGGLDLTKSLLPLVYHIGFDENYKSMAFTLDQPSSGSRLQSVNFEVDIMRLFTGNARIDMAGLPDVKFDKNDAKSIANNYAAMITLRRNQGR